MSLADKALGLLTRAKDFLGNLFESAGLVGQALNLIKGFLDRIVQIGMSEGDLEKIEALDAELGQLIQAKEAEIDGLQHLRVVLRAAISPEGDGGSDITLGEATDIAESFADRVPESARVLDELKDVVSRIKALV